MGANGFTFDDAGTTQRLAQRPADDFNLTHVQLSAGAAGTLDAQCVHALRIRAEGHGLPGVPLQQQPRRSAAHAGEHRRRLPVQRQQSVSRRQHAAQCWRRWMRPKQGRGRCSRVRSRTRPLRTTGWRFSPRGDAWWSCPSGTTSTTTTCGASPLGMKGDLGDASDKFLRNLSYDVYYTLRALRGQQPAGRRCFAQPLRGRAARQRSESAGG